MINWWIKRRHLKRIRRLHAQEKYEEIILTAKALSEQLPHSTHLLLPIAYAYGSLAERTEENRSDNLQNAYDYFEQAFSSDTSSFVFAHAYVAYAVYWHEPDRAKRVVERYTGDRIESLTAATSNRSPRKITSSD